MRGACYKPENEANGGVGGKRRVDRWTPCLPPFLVFHFQIPNLSRLLHLVNFVNGGKFFLELNSKRLCQSSGKENDSRGLTLTSSNKSELRHYHVVVVQWQQRNVQKSVMHGKSCCFAMYKPIAFFPFSLPSPSWLLKPPNVSTRQTEKCVLAV